MSRAMIHPMSKDEILSAIQAYVGKTGRIPSQVELVRNTKVSQRQIVKGVWRVHAGAAGMQSGEILRREQDQDGALVRRLGQRSEDA